MNMYSLCPEGTNYEAFDISGHHILLHNLYFIFENQAVFFTRCTMLLKKIRIES